MPNLVTLSQFAVVLPIEIYNFNENYSASSIKALHHFAPHTCMTIRTSDYMYGYFLQRIDQSLAAYFINKERESSLKLGEVFPFGFWFQKP